MAGGEDNNGDDLSSTEVLYDGGLSWVTGQALPRTLAWPASVSLADSVLLLGTFSTVSYDISQLIMIYNCRRIW